MHEVNVVVPLPGYAPGVGAALWRLEDARRRTLEQLAGMPADVLGREPERGNAVGTILYHLALIEADWLFVESLEGAIPDEVAARWFPLTDRDAQGHLSVARGETLDDHLARLGAIRALFLDALRGMSDEEFHRPRAFPHADFSPAWVLHHLAQHEAEHRSELGAAIAALRARD